jgi:phenylpropionate dioxygenase-like ring-hydroxylating dioxygenase large terminal subunit
MANLMLHNCWYAAAWSEELGKQPLARWILGKELLFRRDAQGRPVVSSNICPHRQARLSNGQLLSDGRIQCPYHAWEYATDGRCVNIPTLPADAEIPRRACLPMYPAVEQQNLIWVWLGEPGGESEYPIPRFDFAALGPEVRHQRLPSTLWDAEFIDLVENALDPSHIQTVHPKTLGPNWAATVGNVTVEPFVNGRGFTATSGAPLRTVPEPLRFDFRKILRLPEVDRAYYRFEFGGTVQVRYEYSNGRYDMAYATITPADDEHTWVFFGILRSHMRHFVGDALQRVAMKLLQKEDLDAIANISPVRPKRFSERVSVESDRMGNLFLKQYQRLLEAERVHTDIGGSVSAAE